jgi:hypothetical protein
VKSVHCISFMSAGKRLSAWLQKNRDPGLDWTENLRSAKRKPRQSPQRLSPGLSFPLITPAKLFHSNT